MPAFIDDGYTIEGYIAADAERDIEAIRFKYRPATSREMNTWRQGLDLLSGEQRAERDDEFVAKHIQQWDVRRPNGTAVDISPPNCGRIDDLTAIKLFNIISGRSPSDSLPSGTADASVNVEAAKGNS